MTTRNLAILTILLTSCYGFGCARHSDERKAETATLNVTHWTEQSELYMEYPPLVAGQPALFAVHLTKLDDFKALNAGTPSIEFTAESGGTRTVLRGSPPSRPGTFRVEGKASWAPPRCSATKLRLRPKPRSARRMTRRRSRI